MRKTIAFFALLLATSAQALDYMEFCRMRATACYSAAASTVIPDLLASWSFDGNAASYPAGYDLIPVGGVTYTNGVYGQAIAFNGVSGYATNGAAVFNQDINRTICAWVFQANNSSARALFAKRDSINTGYFIFVNAGQLIWDSGSGTAQNRWSMFTVTTNAWVHLAFVSQVGSCRAAYTNAVLYGTNATCGTSAASTTLYVGSDSLPGSAPRYFWSGSIDDLRIYNRALTADEIVLVKNGEAVQ